MSERVIMEKKERITVYIKAKDYNLFKRAMKLYNKDASHLAKQIIENWLFNNQLNLLEKDEK